MGNPVASILGAIFAPFTIANAGVAAAGEHVASNLNDQKFAQGDAEKKQGEKQDAMIANENKRINQANAVSKASEQQRAAYARQKSFAAGSSGRAGTILTSPLGVTGAAPVGAPMSGSTGGGKTLLGT